MKSQVLHTVWCNISGEAAGEILNWSLLGVTGSKCWFWRKVSVYVNLKTGWKVERNAWTECFECFRVSPVISSGCPSSPNFGFLAVLTRPVVTEDLVDLASGCVVLCACVTWLDTLVGACAFVCTSEEPLVGWRGCGCWSAKWNEPENRRISCVEKAWRRDLVYDETLTFDGSLFQCCQNSSRAASSSFRILLL